MGIDLLSTGTNTEEMHELCSNIQNVLLGEMRENKWPVAFSIGVLTCHVEPLLSP